MTDPSPHEVIVQVLGNSFGSGDEYARDILGALESAGYITITKPREQSDWGVVYDDADHTAVWTDTPPPNVLADEPEWIRKLFTTTLTEVLGEYLTREKENPMEDHPVVRHFDGSTEHLYKWATGKLKPGLYRHPPVDPHTGEVSADDDAILMGQMRHCDVPPPHRKQGCTALMDDHGWIDDDIDNGDGTHGTTVCPEEKPADSVRCYCDSTCSCFSHGIHDHHDPADCGKEFTVSDEIRAAQYAQTKPVWSLRVFENLPLPVRMRAAANVLTEVNDRQNYGHISAYGRGDLLKLADRWEREDAERLGREKLVEELAQAMRTLAGARNWTEIARTLIDAGWTKVTGDE